MDLKLRWKNSRSLSSTTQKKKKKKNLTLTHNIGDKDPEKAASWGHTGTLVEQ
jgi:hypothetical protein